MDASNVASLGKVDTPDFLVNNPFGVELKRSNTSEKYDFRNRCRKFVDRLVNIILSLHVLSVDFYQGVYAFCPMLLLEGDNQDNFGLFSKLLRVLKKSDLLSGDCNYS